MSRGQQVSSQQLASRLVPASASADAALDLTAAHPLKLTECRSPIMMPGEGGHGPKQAPQEEGQTKSINEMKDELNHQFSITATPAHPGSPGMPHMFVKG